MKLSCYLVRGLGGIWTAAKSHLGRAKTRLVLVLTLGFAVSVIPSAVLYEKWRLQKIGLLAREIRIGTSKAEVEEMLGRPTRRFPKGRQLIDGFRRSNLILWLLLPESYETWCYGPSSLFDIHLGPEEDDIAIEFDDKECVVNVEFPEDRKRRQQLWQ